MALKQSDSGSLSRPKYVFKRKRPYLQKGKREEQSIMAQMMFYMSEARLRGKIQRINDALEAEPVDIATLKELAISADGLVTSDLRRKVWPKLLNVNLCDIQRTSDHSEETEFHSNNYWNQVNLDVNRSYRRFPPEMRASRRKVLQHQLVNVIMCVLCKHQELHYYQGYHDIAVTILLVIGEDLAIALLEQLSLHALRDFMETTMEKTNRLLAFIYPIIAKADPELQEFLIRSQSGQLFALSWLITWFGHVINHFNTIVRLFDFFLATHPLMPVYLSAALIIRRRNDVLLGECEMSFVHHLLSRIPDDFPDYVDELIGSAQLLFRDYPPETLAGAVEQYIKESTAIAKRTRFVRELEDRRPGNALRRRKNTSLPYAGNAVQAYQTTSTPNSSGSVFAKVAVWTLTASVGTIAIYVLSSTTKRWI